MAAVATGPGIFASPAGPGEILAGTSRTDFLSSGGNADTVLGLGGDDYVSIIGQVGSGLLDGGAGRDILDLNAFAVFGTERYTLSFDASDVGRLQVFDAAGNLIGDRTIQGFETTSFTLFGGGGDSLSGSSAGETILLSSAALAGSTIAGNGGADTLFGGPGADSIDGGDGDDRISGGGGADTIDGGDGIDTAGFRGTVQFSGNDTSPDERTNYATFSVDGAGVGTFTEFDETDAVVFTATARNVENFDISGTNLDDTLIGGDGDDTLAPLIAKTDGGDSVDGGAGQDVGVLNTFFFSEIVRFEATATGGEFSLIDASNPSFTFFTTVFENVETFNIGSSRFDDSLVGGAGDDTFSSYLGNDTLKGGGGNDNFTTLGGIGIVDGGDGFDVLLSNSAVPNGGSWSPTREDVVLMLGMDGNGSIVSRDTGGGTVFENTLISIEQIRFTGGYGNDALTAADGDDDLSGLDGADTIDGGGGNDTLIGGLGDDVLIGGEGNDFIRDSDGANTIQAGGGEDTVSIGASFTFGTDSTSAMRFTVDETTGNAVLERVSGGVVIETTTVTEAERFRIYGRSGDDTIGASAGQDTLEGNTGSDLFRATAAQLNGDLIVGIEDGEAIELTDVTGLTQDDIVYDEAEALLMITEGVTIYLGDRLPGTFELEGDRVVYRAPPTVGDPGGGTGGGTGGSGGGTSGAPTCLPGLTLTGDESDDSLTGSEDSDTLIGGGGADTLMGGGCQDAIFAGKGDDMVFGGAEADLLFGGVGTGADTLFAGEGDDVAFGGDGADIVGGGSGNDIVGGAEGDDIVYGEAGEDTVYGGEGADTLYGGSEADILFAASGDDVLAGGSGADEIGAGAGDDEIAAGAGADTIYGGAGSDTIFAVQGADSVFGGAGDDLVFLGAGDGARDVYATTADNGLDTIVGFEDGIDALNLTASGFTAFADIATRIAEDADGNATIDLGNGHILTLTGLSAASLDAGDFAF